MRLKSHSIRGVLARIADITSNMPPQRIHSTPIQSVSSILLSFSGGIWFIAYWTPKTQVLIEATKKNAEAQSSLRDVLLISASSGKQVSSS
jgi:hypothetical protein